MIRPWLLGLGLLAARAAAQVTPVPAPPSLPDPLAAPRPRLIDLPSDLSPRVVALGTDEAANRHGDDIYQPQVGQPGKDVIWVPTPEPLIRAMLAAARVTPDDFVVDLGSGDGRIPIIAAREFGARAHGIDYNGDMVALARRLADRQGLRGKVSFQRGDIFESDFSTASVVTLYLLPSLNLKLRPQLLALRPGTRVLSHAFDMGDWEPDQVIRTDVATGYLWFVPARVEGRWAFEVQGQRFAATLTQKFQNLSARGGPLTSGRLKGNDITLALANGRELKGRVLGDDRMVGPGWSASRIALR